MELQLVGRIVQALLLRAKGLWFKIQVQNSKYIWRGWDVRRSYAKNSGSKFCGYMALIWLYNYFLLSKKKFNRSQISHYRKPVTPWSNKKFPHIWDQYIFEIFGLRWQLNVHVLLGAYVSHAFDSFVRSVGRISPRAFRSSDAYYLSGFLQGRKTEAGNVFWLEISNVPTWLQS
jgi:hypothetical protein